MASKTKKKKEEKPSFYFCTKLVRADVPEGMVLTHSTETRRKEGIKTWVEAGYKAVFWTSKHWPCGHIEENVE